MVTVEAGAVVSAGRYGVAAFGSGGNVSVTNDGTIMGTTDAVDATTASTGTVVLDNAGYLSGNVISYNATFTNEASALWSLNGQNVFTGASTLSNAGVIDSNGTSVISGLSGITNTGLIEVLSGSLVLSEPVTGAGTAIIYSATLEFGGASDANVQFATSTTATSGTLVLDDVAHFAGTVTGFTSRRHHRSCGDRSRQCQHHECRLASGQLWHRQLRAGRQLRPDGLLDRHGRPWRYGHHLESSGAGDLDQQSHRHPKRQWHDHNNGLAGLRHRRHGVHRDLHAHGDHRAPPLPEPLFHLQPAPVF